MDKELKIFMDKINAASTIAVFAHKNPDGDALCSVLAMARLIELNFGKRALCVYDGNIPNCLDNVPCRHKIKYYAHADLSAPFDLAIVLDYGTRRNLGGAAEIVDKAKYIVEIDHHINDDHIANLCINDISASSVGEILFRIIKKCDLKYDAYISDLLAVSILTDTGFFKYVRRGAPLRIMAQLVDGGVSIGRLAESLNNKPRKTIQTEAAAAANAEFFYHNKLALATITAREYKNLDGRGETVLNLLGQIKGVEYIALLKQQKENQIGVSLRSRAKPIDHIATALGGGGHAYAAGAVVYDSLENVREKILTMFRGA